jgi:hypothetical protein
MYCCCPDCVANSPALLTIVCARDCIPGLQTARTTLPISHWHCRTVVGKCCCGALCRRCTAAQLSRRAWFHALCALCRKCSALVVRVSFFGCAMRESHVGTAVGGAAVLLMHGVHSAGSAPDRESCILMFWVCSAGGTLPHSYVQLCFGIGCVLLALRCPAGRGQFVCWVCCMGSTACFNPG